MKITDAFITNFLTIGETTLKLSDKGLVLVQGENLDDDSADSNGAGKSSVPDAICWALYGETARGVKGDAVVNHKSKKNCAVSVVIQDGASEYMISRHRKHAKSKNRLEVFVDGVDKTKGTDKLTQEFVNEIMGCSLDVFRAAVYAGQEQMPDLPGMTDKALKVLVEEAAGIDKLQGAYEIARRKLAEAKAEEMSAAAKVNTHKDQKEQYESRMLEAEDNKSEFEKKRKTDMEALKAKLLTTKKKADEIKAKADAMPIGKYTDELDEVKANIASVDKEKEKLEELSKAKSDADSDLRVIVSGINTLKESLEKAKLDLENADHKVGQKCGECGKEHTDDDVAYLREAAEAKIATFKKTLAAEVKTAKGLKEAAESASDAVEKHKASMTDISAAVARERELNALLRDHADLVRDYTAERNEIDRIMRDAKKKKEEENPWQKVVENALKTAKEHADAIEDAEKAAEKAAMNTKLHEDAVEVFGQAGVRAHILDTVTPYLNERTSHYLSTLSDGNITAEWSTLTTTSKGELREKFNIAVQNDKGANSFQGLSGGEKRKVRLSAAMALQDMVASRASKPIELFIADEVDHALDESGLERLMSILNEKATDRGTVLVISHNELSDWIREQATVTKKGGYSTVSGVLS